MAVISENVIVLYRNGNADSYAFAQAYQSIHSLDSSQIIAISCSGSQILPSYAEFQSEIESQVLPHVTASTQVIIVGYGVPGGFMDGEDTIATTSRLSRIQHTYSKQISNPLYNRQVYQAYSVDDANVALIVSRIDAPSLDIALSAINNMSKVIKQGSANGTFFFDKYAEIENDDESAYQSDLTFFETRLLPLLNVAVQKTVFWDEYTDVVIPKLEGDNFMWAWKANRAGYSFFETTKSARIFLYNADMDGAGELRDVNDKRFPMLALSSGYASTAGAMSDPSPLGHLRPQPFFNALYRGTTIGEAFLYACPFLDWTVSLIGDPLVTVSFPASQAVSDAISINTGWNILQQQISTAIAYGYAANNNLQDILQTIIAYTDIPTKALFAPFNNVATANGGWISNYRQSVIQLISLIASNSQNQISTLSSYLSLLNIQVSALLLQAGGITLSAFQSPSGLWFAETTLINDSSNYNTYQFQMDISLDSTFESILYTFNSEVSALNWYYEDVPGSFSAFPSTGVTSSYAGRRIRYIAPQSQSLTTGEIFYYRVRQKNIDGDLSAYTVYESIVST